MAIRNQNWYNLNESRDYPLADAASAIDDENNRLPQGIIAAIRVRWPDWAGEYAFLGSVAVTSGAVTATVLCATDLTNAGSNYIPIAVATVPLQDLEQARQYPMESMYPGSFGYITFGSGVVNNYSGKFSSPAQSLLSSRAARPHSGLPVTGLGKLYDNVSLTGLVRLEAEEPLQINKEVRKIYGNEKEVVVFSLTTESDAVADAGLTESVLQALAGPCGARPESNTCGFPLPIEYINAVSPDCNGVITLELKGCAVVGRNIDDGSIIVDCGTGINDTCVPPFIPDDAGRLPSERTPIIPTPPIPPEPPGDESISESYTPPDFDIPFCDTFIGPPVHKDWSVTGGSWNTESDSSPEDPCSADTSQSESGQPVEFCVSTNSWYGRTYRNMYVFTPDTQTVYRKYQTDLKLLSYNPDDTSESYNTRNGGVLVNYRVLDNGAKTFWFATMDTTSSFGRFSLKYFNGVTEQELTGQDYAFLNDVWYRITLTVTQQQLSPGNLNMLLTAQLVGITDSSISITLGPYPVPVSDYIGSLGDSGKAGLHANEAATRFSYFRVDENL